MSNTPDLSYIDKLSREEILEHLMRLPIEDLRIRLKAFESAKRSSYLKFKARLKSDQEFAKRFQTFKQERQNRSFNNSPDNE